MIETGKELADACIALASEYKTIYGLGCFGWPMNRNNRERVIRAYPYNRKAQREAVIRGASEDTFAFDCVNMIKALLWGWCGDSSKTYGGAVYASNQVPDVNADAMIGLCSQVTSDFSKIQTGEALWMKGHIGVYIGDGLAVECTPRWADGVQITAVHNIGKKSGYHGRKWTSHGKLPYVRYEIADLTFPNLKRGAKSETVKALQLLLNGFGYDCGKADGIFGAKTEDAVRAFQKNKGLESDGIAGICTFCALLGVAGS